LCLVYGIVVVLLLLVVAPGYWIFEDEDGEYVLGISRVRAP